MNAYTYRLLLILVIVLQGGVILYQTSVMDTQRGALRDATILAGTPHTSSTVTVTPSYPSVPSRCSDGLEWWDSYLYVNDQGQVVGSWCLVTDAPRRKARKL